MFVEHLEKPYRYMGVVGWHLETFDRNFLHIFVETSGDCFSKIGVEIMRGVVAGGLVQVYSEIVVDCELLLLEIFVLVLQEAKGFLDAPYRVRILPVRGDGLGV